MSVITPIPAPSTTDEGTDLGPARVEHLAPVVTLADHRPTEALEPAVADLAETGAASAEYAAVTACGVGLAGVLMKLLSSDFGQQLLESVLKFFLGMVGIG
ncbi:DUF4244 domain-containing protein [Nocardioides sp. HDW12B]|uniref:DUF4244 domain-containing protein n=1 Tax=Nocardioides sp. HDW12B TaxID=2714939 RepID=UPI00140A9099|nr:DUF4244 domain-containing protein [Nocardioides sp. HDW12B]QIK67632.1 DUF4244 domain-containing protein [Nocardioides sp. HDW12B]